MFKFINNFLKKIEEQNSKSFGSGKLDCCDLNKSKDASKKVDAKSKWWKWGDYNSIIVVATMSFSSVSVILNALRLKGFK